MANMSFVEGFGDEVIIVSIFMLLLFIVSIFYLSDGLPFSFVITYLSDWHFRRREEGEETENTGDNHVTSTEAPDTDETPLIESQSDPSSSDSHDEVANIEDEQPCEIEKSDENDAPELSTPDSSVGNNHVGSSEHTSDIKSTSFVTSVASEEENKSSSSDQIPGTVPDDIQPPKRERTNNSTLPPDVLEIRLKYLNDTERIVRTEFSVKIGEFKRTHFAEDISNSKVVKLIYNGQLLRDNLKISEYGITSGTVVHVHIANAPSPQAQSNETTNDLDLSAYLCPLFGLILAICWMSCFQYPDYFSVPSIVLLVVFTLSFLIVYSRSPIPTS